MRHIPEKTHVVDKLPSALVCEVFDLEFSIDEATSQCIQKRKQRLASLPGDGGEGGGIVLENGLVCDSDWRGWERKRRT